MRRVVWRLPEASGEFRSSSLAQIPNNFGLAVGSGGSAKPPCLRLGNAPGRECRSSETGHDLTARQWWSVCHPRREGDNCDRIHNLILRCHF